MKRIISCIIVLAIILSTNIGSFSVKAGGDENTDRIVCQATLEDNFADNCVLVVIDEEHSEINKEFRLEDFPGVDITEIRDLSYITGDPYSNPYLNTVGFKQILKLTLKNSGKEEVLKQIKNLENLDFIYAAEPDYYFGVDDGFIYSEDEDIGGKKSEGDNEYDEMPSDDACDNDLWQIEETVSEELPNEEITNESNTGENHLRDIAKKAPSEMTAQREKPERAAYNDSERDTCAPLIGTDEIFTAIGAVMILRFAAVLIH